MAWDDFLKAEAWRNAMAKLLKKGEEVGSYIEQAPGKAGQAILEGHQKNQELWAKAHANPQRPFQVTDQNAFNELNDRYMGGVLSFAPVGMTKLIGPQSEAMEIAQKNAALPVSQGGLGLPPNNTAMDRAKALGYDTPAYHGTRIDFQEFQPKSWFSSDPKYASEYSNVLMKVEPEIPTQQVFPVLTKITKPHKVQYFGSEADMNKILDAGKKGSYVIENVGGGNTSHYVIKDPKNIRSINAAFDPKRINEADILAGVAPLGLLTDEDTRKEILQKLFDKQDTKK